MIDFVALRALESLGPTPESLPRLVAALDHDSPLFREVALKTIDLYSEVLLPGDLRDRVRAMAGADPSPGVRATARDVALLWSDTP